MSVEWTSSEPRNFLSKGNYSPRFCYRPPVCVGFGNFSPLEDFLVIAIPAPMLILVFLYGIGLTAVCR